MIRLLTEIPERKKSMPDFKVAHCPDTLKLMIEYAANTDKVVYGISDLDGRVISKGDYHGPKCEICIKDLKTGRYQIWLMDGEDMIRTNFKVA